MLTLHQIRELHLLECGARLHEVCLLEECDCLCHEPQFWGDLLDEVEWNQEYFNVVVPRMWEKLNNYDEQEDYGAELPICGE